MITADSAEAARPKGRPRSRATARAITEAVLDLIAESASIETLSIEAIATRAGVGKATIYRRWPNKEALVVDAVGTMKSPMPVLAGDSVRDDLLAIGKAVRRVQDTREGQIFPCLALELKRNPELAKHHERALEERRETIRGVIRRGIALGELRPDLDIEAVIAIFMAPLLSVAVFQMYPSVDQSHFAEKIVDYLLAGIAVES